MRHCGVVTDRSTLTDELSKAIQRITGEPLNTQVCVDDTVQYPDRPRIYSDEVPMADENTILRIKNRKLWEKDKLGIGK